MSAASAKFFDDFTTRVGAVISGRRTYDLVDAWNGTGPLPGAPLFVLTHRPPRNPPSSEPPYTYVANGIESAIEQAKAATTEVDERRDREGLLGSSIIISTEAHHASP